MPDDANLMKVRVFLLWTGMFTYRYDTYFGEVFLKIVSII